MLWSSQQVIAVRKLPIIVSDTVITVSFKNCIEHKIKGLGHYPLLSPPTFPTIHQVERRG